MYLKINRGNLGLDFSHIEKDRFRSQEYKEYVELRSPWHSVPYNFQNGDTTLSSPFD